MSSTSEVEGSIDQLVTRMSDLGVDVVWSAFILKDFPGLPHLCFEQAPERKVLRACQLLLRELEFYGRHVLQVTHLERIILCSKLRDQAGTRLDGCQYSGIPDCVIFDISGPDSKLEWLQSTFHHEFFHLLDYHADYHHHVEWSDIFEASSEYAPTYDYKPRDYASVYAMTSPSDDKAELYAHLITDYRQVIGKMLHSKILTEKVVRMKRILRQFAPDFDDSFWERVSKRDHASRPD